MPVTATDAPTCPLSGVIDIFGVPAGVGVGVASMTVKVRDGFAPVVRPLPTIKCAAVDALDGIVTFVGQETIGDVPVRIDSGSHERSVSNAHAMVKFVFVLH